MSSFDLNAIIGQIGRDKGIDRTVLVEAVESAMLSAARRHFGHNLNLETRYNEDTGEIEVVQFKTVVDVVLDEGTQVSLEDARELFDKGAMIGDEFGSKLPTDELGRIAAQTAKQVIIQKVRDAERGVIYDEYKNSKGDLVNGIVQRYDKGSLIVNLGRTEAVLPKREQILKEKYRQGDRIRCMILDIDRSARGPQIILTRSHPDFLKKLFELEVPEIADKTIEIKAVAREPGERAKISVYSTEAGLDPVGACVGVKGVRVKQVVDELRGERIDIIPWTADEPSFVARALQPAEVTRVVVDEEAHSMEVIVDDKEYAKALGRSGQNVKLASKLTGWRIDVRSESMVEEETKRARASLEAIPGIAFHEIEMLLRLDFRSPARIAQANPEDFDGFERSRADAIIKAASEYVDELEAKGFLGSEENRRKVGDLEKLGLPIELKEKLEKAGFYTIQDVMVAEAETLDALPGMDEEEVSLIREKRDEFTREFTRAR